MDRAGSDDDLDQQRHRRGHQNRQHDPVEGGTGQALAEPDPNGEGHRGRDRGGQGCPGAVAGHLPLTEQVRNYRYVKVGSMLMLRDDSDQTLVFERVYR